MGTGALTLRRFYLENYRWQLNTKRQSIMETKLEVTKNASEIENTGASLSPDSMTYKNLKERKQKLAILDKELDLALEKIKIQSEMVDKELQANEQAFNKELHKMYSHAA